MVGVSRSYLFVPGHKSAWIEKATRSGADALILDLEDSVPFAGKSEARSVVAEAAQRLCDDAIEVFVRVNSWGSGHLVLDLEAIVGTGVAGIFLSKSDSPQHVAALDQVLSDLEVSRHLTRGGIEIVPLLETAAGMRRPYKIVRASTRVRRLAGVTGPTRGGDIVRALRRQWTPEGLEALFSDSLAILDARAADLDQVIAGPSTSIEDLDLLRRLMMRARQLGADGAMAIHPSHVPIINEVFTPSPDEIAAAVALIRTFAQAIAVGDAAARHDGEMIDYAHVRTSMDLIARARAAGIDVADVPELELPAMR